MGLTVPVGAVDPAYIPDDFEPEEGSRTVSMNLTSVVQTGVVPDQPVSPRAVLPRRVASGGSEAVNASAQRDSGSETEQPRTPSEGARSFDPERSARAQSSPPISRQSRSTTRMHKMPKSGDAGGAGRVASERKVSGQSTKSHRSLDFAGGCFAW